MLKRGDCGDAEVRMVPRLVPLVSLSAGGWLRVAVSFLPITRPEEFIAGL
jgi:hypothetical protein